MRRGAGSRRGARWRCGVCAKLVPLANKRHLHFYPLPSKFNHRNRNLLSNLKMDQLHPSIKSVKIIGSGPCHCLDKIELLLVFAALLMVLRYILDIFRSRSSNRMLKLSLLILDALPFIYLDFAIGLMQLRNSKNDLYQVWAIVMVTLRYSISVVRPSSIYWEQKPLMDMMTTLWTANLLGTRTTKLKAPLWLLRSLNSVRLILGFADLELGPTKLQRNVQFISEYMRNEHKINATYYSPKDMKGYRHLVWGENKQKVETHAPEYRVQVLVTEKRKFLTVEKIWQEENILLQNNADSNQLKDLCLSFALFKLLQRRILGLPLYEAKQQKTKDLVNELLQDYDRAFSIIKVELAFLTEFYYTRFGIIFAKGFPTLRLVLSLSVVGVCVYLLSAFAGSLHVLFVDVSDNTDKNSSNLIVFVTWILVVSLMLRKFWEMVTYALSDWTKVILVCNSFQKKWWMKCPGILLMMRFLCKKRVASHWHTNLQQHNLLIE